MRFAGTASQYSKNAMPQLTITAIQSAVVLNFRCPYQAKVMKTFDATSISTGVTCGFMEGPGLQKVGESIGRVRPCPILLNGSVKPRMPTRKVRLRNAAAA